MFVHLTFFTLFCFPFLHFFILRNGERKREWEGSFSSLWTLFGWARAYDRPSDSKDFGPQARKKTMPLK